MKEKRTSKYFGEYGGSYVPEELRPALEELDECFNSYIRDARFLSELFQLQRDFIGRPTPLLYAENATKALGGAKIYLKLEGLANTGAHKINNAIGQALLAKRMNKKRVIAETGAGQHGMATACACAKMGLECSVFMGEIDVARQRPNVFWMEIFGAEVIQVKQGTKTLTDAVDAAFDEWMKCYDNTYYCIGSALGPSPYPDIVREFQSIIGRETRKQFYEFEGRVPDVMIACVGGGSNSIGFFNDFIDDTNVRLIAVEGGGRGNATGEHAARMNGSGSVGINQGYKSYFIQDNDGHLLPTHSISAGLDYAGIGPQIAYLGDNNRIEFLKAMDTDVIEAFNFFAKHEGIIPALESSHALSAAMKLAPSMDKDQSIIVNVSGRGDKDIFITSAAVNTNGKWLNFLKEEIVRLERS
ncbi:MAG TPA: tryptophan synthase subunit beta [bacterium]|nr:tryptophan synthase subunit beta [bacterium]